MDGEGVGRLLEAHRHVVAEFERRAEGHSSRDAFDALADRLQESLPERIPGTSLGLPLRILHGERTYFLRITERGGLLLTAEVERDGA